MAAYQWSVDRQVFRVEQLLDGIKELRQPENLPKGRVRRGEAGRKKSIEKDPALKKDLELLIVPYSLVETRNLH